VWVKGRELKGGEEAGLAAGSGSRQEGKSRGGHAVYEEEEVKVMSQMYIFIQSMTERE